MSNFEVYSAIHGIAPRSDELLKIGTDVEKGRISERTYDDLLEEESTDWIELQREAGIDIIENGKLRWQDHLRPIVKATQGFASGIDAGPVTRWFETNAFYRRPTITGNLILDETSYKQLIGQTDEVVSLISPETFAVLCGNTFSQPSIENVGALYRQLVQFYSREGIQRLILEEYIKHPTYRESPLINSGRKIAEKLSREFPGIQVSYLRIGELPRMRPRGYLHALGLGARSLGNDYQRTVQPAGPTYEGREIWQQVIRSDTTDLDHLYAKGDLDFWPETFIKGHESRAGTGPYRFILTNTVDLERLPLTFAKRKVKRLGQLATRLNEYFGGFNE